MRERQSAIPTHGTILFIVIILFISYFYLFCIRVGHPPLLLFTFFKIRCKIKEKK